ncbi:hypothetical protein GUITHDRAFT_136304 [Guillardia theta CCMP2712]|uniref:Uncharacterized protein n=1 Tax=Guillardia theta (strain CCMP2712) TaxID=905079 RepID=L1JLW2_GUITC|nr:hypothetical protein GUITHDRAFT_136304 [Guillardia theta CCMP2712]EKX49140.1 hypothetical protein GUITHDRAFT_136304 [Guillardia theta CCMP2712]|eukprot:XP_005836120.1 hypothetical protein GUITHDRAFT_136304 [Guillardia theta CCMP2712]
MQPFDNERSYHDDLRSQLPNRNYDAPQDYRGYDGYQSGTSGLIDEQGMAADDHAKGTGPGSSSSVMSFGEPRNRTSSYSDSRESRHEQQRRYKAELDRQIQEKNQGGQDRSRSQANRVSCSASVWLVQSDRNCQPTSIIVPENPTSPGLKEAAGKVSSMHWGERDVKQWYEAEDRKKSYREELMQQIREKERSRTGDSARSRRLSGNSSFFSDADDRGDSHLPALPSLTQGVPSSCQAQLPLILRKLQRDQKDYHNAYADSHPPVMVASPPSLLPVLIPPQRSLAPGHALAAPLDPRQMSSARSSVETEVYFPGGGYGVQGSSYTPSQAGSVSQEAYDALVAQM